MDYASVYGYATDTDEEWDEETQAIVIDNGSGSIKAGFAGDDTPRVQFPSIVRRPKIVDSGIAFKDVYIGDEIMQNDLDIVVKYPIKHGMVMNWDDMEKIWHHTFYNALKIQPEEHSVLLTEAPLTPKANREKCLQIMFETFCVPATYNGIQAVLSLYATGRTTGIVLDSGFDSTHSVPIYEGYALPHAILRGIEHFNGNDITKCLMKLCDSNISMDIANDIKETLCFIAPRDNYNDNKYEEYALPDGKVINIGSERFKCTQILFQNKDEEAMNIQNMIYESIIKCDIDIRNDLYNNIVLSGGNTLFKGMQTRLHHEMRKTLHCYTKIDGFTRKYFAEILPSDVMNIIYRNNDHFEIAAPPDVYSYRAHSAWMGGSILASLTTFQEMWICKDEYDESGPGIIHRKIF